MSRCRSSQVSQRSPATAKQDSLFTICHLPFTIPIHAARNLSRFIRSGHQRTSRTLIERGCKLFDEIIIAILVNPDKQPFFSIEERRHMLEKVLKTIEQRNCQLRVDDFEGLLVHYALAQKAHAIVRGIRAISDYEYELQMALMNRRLEPSIETVFMMPAETYSYVSSRLVKEVFQLGGELDGLVPPLVEERMKQKVKKS